MLHFLLARFAMPYRRTANVIRKLAARHDAILAAACEAAAEGGMAAVQIAPVAARAGIATGTVYRYFPSKTELVAALVAALCEREVAALAAAAQAAPGSLSALAAAISAFAARALERRRLAFALMAEPVEPEIDGARASYRQALIGEFEKLIRKALDAGRLPDQDAALAARGSSARARPPPRTSSPQRARGSRCSRCLRCARSGSSMRARADWWCRR